MLNLGQQKQPHWVIACLFQKTLRHFARLAGHPVGIERPNRLGNDAALIENQVARLGRGGLNGYDLLRLEIKLDDFLSRQRQIVMTVGEQPQAGWGAQFGQVNFRRGDAC